ncbi:MAG: DEAD/DEAH box helicase, partial [Coriobacteriaceae bacterium]|nr:DEAD/DEAH box helicase [Coriobacteriaceae bacterium]
MEIDSAVDLGELTLENVAAIDRLAPFGQENPLPCFLARNVIMTNCRAVGADKNHFSCTLTDGRASVAAIMFHCGQLETFMATEAVVDAVFRLQIDEWRGRRTVKAMLVAISPARFCGALRVFQGNEAHDYVESLYAKSDDELVDENGRAASGEGTVQAATPGDALSELAECRARWEAIAAQDPAGLEGRIVQSILGPQGSLHAAQSEALEALRKGESVFSIMATGRGKTLIFQVHAAYLALVEKKASLFIYPLRALIADQAYHLGEAMRPFGIRSAVLTGETSAQERVSTYEGLARGTVDVVLTTPEYLSFHAEELSSGGRIDFVVVDEAHHIGSAKAGHRSAYLDLRRAIDLIRPSKVLALTATANEAIARDICSILPIDARVIDDSCRENLNIVDYRGCKNRDDYLANLVARGEKTIIYVNSRLQSVAVARMLRKSVPQLAPMIGFYNAGLTPRDRKRIEELF